MSIRPQDLKSNIRVARQLSDSVKRGSVVHAYAFIGGSSTDRSEIGNWMAKYLLCEDPDDGPCMKCLQCRKAEHGNHEDLLHIGKPDDRESIVKDQILELTDRISYKPFGKRYVVIIEDAQLMNAAAQNKLLKTLEEPVSEAVMILLSENEEALLPTVLSRCCVFRLEEPEGADSPDSEAAKAFAALIRSKAPFYKKKALLADILADKENSRERGLLFIDKLMDCLMGCLKDGTALSAEEIHLMENAVHSAQQSRKYLKQVHSVVYTLKQMCLRV